MANLPYAITTTSKVKTHLGISVSTYDAVIDTIVNSVTDFIEGYCNRRFLETTYTNEIYDGGEPNQVGGFRNKIMLKQFPVSSVTTVEYMSGSYSSPVWNTLSANFWLLMAKAGYIQSLAGNFARGFQNIRVTYVAGFKIDFTSNATEIDPTKHTLPADITLVATQLAAKAYDKRFSEGKEREIVEGSQIVWLNELTVEQKSVLDGYVKHLL